MKRHLLPLVCATALLCGCVGRDVPIDRGELLHCKLWDKPCPRQGELGGSSFKTITSGKIRIYDGLIVVTEPDGTKHAAPPDWFSEIRFK